MPPEFRILEKWAADDSGLGNLYIINITDNITNIGIHPFPGDNRLNYNRICRLLFKTIRKRQRHNFSWAVPSNWDQAARIYFRLLAESPVCRDLSLTLAD